MTYDLGIMHVWQVLTGGTQKVRPGQGVYGKSNRFIETSPCDAVQISSLCTCRRI